MIFSPLFLRASVLEYQQSLQASIADLEEILRRDRVASTNTHIGWEREEEEEDDKEEEVEEERGEGEDEEGKRQEDAREREGAMFSLLKLHVPHITVPVSNPSSY